MAASILADGTSHLRQRPRHRRRGHHERAPRRHGAHRPPRPGHAEHLAPRAPGRHRARGALRARRAHPGLHRGARAAAGPLRAGAGVTAGRRRLRPPAHRHAPARASRPSARRSSCATATWRPGPTTCFGADITLEFPSVGATENILMAAVHAQGHDGARQRRPRARDRRPLPLPQHHGRQGRGRRVGHGSSSTVSSPDDLTASAPQRGARPGGGGHLPGRGGHHRWRGRDRAAPGPSTWTCSCARSWRWG